MSISRFFQITALGLFVPLLAACGSPASEPVVATPLGRIAEERKVTAAALPTDRQGSDGAGVVAYSEDPSISAYSSFKSFGFSRGGAGTAGVLDANSGADLARTAQTSKTLCVRTSFPLLNPGRSSYTPFYLCHGGCHGG